MSLRLSLHAIKTSAVKPPRNNRHWASEPCHYKSNVAVGLTQPTRNSAQPQKGIQKCFLNQLLTKFKTVADTFASSLSSPNMIPAVEQLAEIRIACGDEAADEAVARAMKLRERKFGSDSDEVTNAFESFANLFNSAGQSQLANDYFTRASNIRDRHANALFV